MRALSYRDGKSFRESGVQGREEGVASLVFDDVIGEDIVFRPLVVGQEAVQAVRDAVAEDALVVLQEQGVVFFVDESRLDEDGRHARPAQYGEAGCRLDAAIREVRGDVVYRLVELGLHVLGNQETPIGACAVVGLAATSGMAAAGIGMDGDEDVGIPAVRACRDVWLSRRFAAQVVALQDLDLVVAEAFEHEGTVGRDAGGDITFALAVVHIECAGIRIAVRGVTGIDKDLHNAAPFFLVKTCVSGKSVLEPFVIEFDEQAVDRLAAFVSEFEDAVAAKFLACGGECAVGMTGDAVQ